jgi:6,7-dimethyl-8-ribityllumazine synthase
MEVPGAFELPLACLTAARTGSFDAVIALGVVIRGDTPHFDYVAGEASRGLADASAEYEIPIGFGLLTTDTMEQAESRAGGTHGNKGWDADVAALEIADLFERLDGTDEA